MQIACFIRYQIDPFQREAYRARLRADEEGRANFAFAQRERFILREERSFCAVVEGTLGLPPAPGGGR